MFGTAWLLFQLPLHVDPGLLDHDKVAVPPGATDIGDAVNELITNPCDGFVTRCTITDLATDLPFNVHVREYTVEAVGVTCWLPVAA